MSNRLNMETGDRTKPVEQPVSIRVGNDLLEFTVYLPRYIADKLTSEDWVEAGRELRRHRDAIVGASVMSGEWFCPGGVEQARVKVRLGMNDLIYERFKQRQVEAGETAWLVPSLLQGERYAI